jgi:threonine dehydratase
MASKRRDGLDTKQKAPGMADILAAQSRISGVAVRTPLIEAPSLSRAFGVEVYLKLECFQPIRVFKIRGAYNKLAQIREREVVAASSGNHGIAVSYACHLLDKSCTVVVPETAVQEKVDAIEDFGADVIRYGRYTNEREAKARQIVASKGGILIHPFDDPDIIAGQGTCGLEITEQLSEFDSVVVPVGGGGLISGIAVAIKERRPTVKIFGAEPTGARKLQPSLEGGRIVTVENPTSIADGLTSRAIGEIPFRICSRLVDGAFGVSDTEIVSAVRNLAVKAHIISEPSGAAPLAVLQGMKDISILGERVVLVISGANVSLEWLISVLKN